MAQEDPRTPAPQEKGARQVKEILSSTGPVSIAVLVSTVILNAKGMAELVSGTPSDRLLFGFGIVGPVLLTLVLAAGWLPRWANAEAVRTRLIVSVLAALIWGTGISFGTAVLDTQYRSHSSPPPLADTPAQPNDATPTNTLRTPASARVQNNQDITLYRDYSLDLHAESVTPFAGCIEVCDANVRSDSLRGNSTTYTRMNGSVDYDKCVTAGPGIKIIPKNELTQNAVYCVRTNDGRFAMITILATDPSPPASGDLRSVTMRFVSWTATT